jgi:hypothetical protein
MSKTEGPGSRMAAGTRDLIYNDLVDTSRAIVGAMVNRRIPG